MKDTKKAGASQDRVWVSCGEKINLGDYESASVDAGMASDVREGESVEQALARCRKIIQLEIDARVARIRKGNAYKR